MEWFEANYISGIDCCSCPRLVQRLASLLRGTRKPFRPVTLRIGQLSGSERDTNCAQKVIMREDTSRVFMYVCRFIFLLLFGGNSRFDFG